MPALSPIQDLIKTRVAAQTYFSSPTAVEIVTEDDGDIETRVLSAVAGLGGMAVLILVPTGDNVDPGKSGAVYTLNIEVHLVESPIINRAGMNKPAYEACRKLLASVAQGGLDGWEPGGAFTKLEAQGYDATAGEVNSQGLIIYTAKFKCSETIG